MSVLESRIVALRSSAARVSYVEGGQGTALVLLHGIGSGARSWRNQLLGLSGRYHVIAWDAPGYGQSSPLPMGRPDAGDYAASLAAFLDALGVEQLHLVGHSLGALMAARFAAEHPDRILSLTLASMATGHARLAAEERERLLQGRLGDLADLGPRGMAEKRGPRLLGPDATDDMRQAVIDTMASIRPDGYRQAVRMLSQADLRADIARLPASMRVQVVFGDADVVTPPEANRSAASVRSETPIRVIARGGHAVYLEKPTEFNEMLSRFVDAR